MTRDKERLISSITASKVEQKLKNYEAKAEGKAALQSALTDLTGSIDVGELYDATTNEVNDIISNRNYTQALRIYNNKGLVAQVSPLFGFRHPALLEFIKRRVSSVKGDDLIATLKSQVPSLPTQP